MQTMSFVDVSPSTVMLLNDFSIEEFNIRFKVSEDKFASVNKNASIVAMFGAIMPEPLHIPTILCFLFPINVSLKKPLGKVSVVVIALANANQSSFLFLLEKIMGIACIILLMGNCSPITPVDEIKIFSLSHLKVSAKLATIFKTFSYPFFLYKHWHFQS